MISNPEVDALCSAQFEEAKDRAGSFLYAVNIDHYDYGHTWGRSILAAHDNSSSAEPLSMLDIGAGEGTFLSEIQKHTSRHIQPTGLTATKTKVQAPKIKNEIKWVYGDVQRPETWQPDDALPSESIDVAVSSLTFRHLVDPLRAIHNVIALLKPEGELFVDNILIVLDAEGSKDAVEIVLEDLRRHQGECGFRIKLIDWESIISTFTTLYINDAHFRRQTQPPIFNGLTARVTGKRSPVLAYSFAA